jgi:hypothetical protein
MDGSTAIWRALRVPGRLAGRAGLAVGVVECATGAGACVRVYPVASGVAMASLGAAFCALLTYVRITRVPGECGCLGWGRKANAAAETVGWRAIARGGMLCAAGIADCLAASGGTGPFRYASFYAGVLAGGAVLTLLSVRVSVRTPGCHRPVWRPSHASMRALTGHEVFAAMASAAGPLGSDVRHRRAGCTDEFWFPVTGNDEGKAVVFRVSYEAPGALLAVHAAVHGSRTPESAAQMPSQRLHVVGRH